MASLMLRMALHRRSLASAVPVPAGRLFRREMSADPLAAGRLQDLGLLKTHGLVGEKWIDAYDGKTLEEELHPLPGNKRNISPLLQGYEKCTTKEIGNPNGTKGSSCIESKKEES